MLNALKMLIQILCGGKEKTTMIDSLRRGLLFLQRFCWRHPRTILSSVLILILVASFYANRIQVLLSIDDLIDKDFLTYSSLKKVNESFPDRSTVLLSIESDELFSKQYLCDLQYWILETAESRQDLIQINSSFGVPKPEVSKHKFRVPSGLDLDCGRMEDPEKEKIAAGLNWVRQSPWKDLLSIEGRNGLTVNFLVRDKKYGSIDTSIVAALKESYQKSLGQKYPELHTYWGGITTFQSYLRAAFEQMLSLNGLMLIISLLVFRFFLGSWRAGVLFNLSALLTFILLYGVMGFFNFPLDALTSSVGLMTMISCLEDFAFVAFGIHKFGWSLRKSLRKFLVPSFVTSVTTAIGFGSLVTSDLGIIRRFGLISSMAAMVEWAMVFLVLPAALKMWPRFKLFHFSRRPTLPLRDPFSMKSNRWVSVGLVALVLSLMLGYSSLHVKDSPGEIFASGHEARKTLDHLQSTRGWINEASLLFADASTPAQESEILSQVEKLPNIHRIESIQAIKGFLTQGMIKEDQKLMERLWENSYIARRLEADDGTRRAQVFLKSTDMDIVSSTMEAVERICPKGECTLVGGLISYNEFSVRILQTLFHSLFISLMLVGFILFSISKHLTKKELIACLVSSAWGPLALVGVFVLFKIPLFYMTSVCASVLVGLTGDNAIQFIFRARRSRVSSSVDELAEASLIITVGMILMTTVFLLSVMAPLAKLGGLMILGFAFGYFGDIFILKGLLREK